MNNSSSTKKQFDPDMPWNNDEDININANLSRSNNSGKEDIKMDDQSLSKPTSVLDNLNEVLPEESEAEDESELDNLNA